MAAKRSAAASEHTDERARSEFVLKIYHPNMKLKSLLLAAVVSSSFAGLQAAEKIVAGPKGGRLLETVPQKAEFFVTKDRKVEITFYDAALKPAAVGTEVVAVTAEPKSGRTKVELEKTANGFVSKEALPAADEAYRVVVQVREKPEAAPKNFRIDLNLGMCGECQHAEYACTCDH